MRVASGAFVRYAWPMRKARVPILVAGVVAAVVVAQSCQDNCDGALQFCTDACYDLTRDIDNCGACSAFCSFAEECADASCIPVSFPDAGTDADGAPPIVAEECAYCARLVLFPEGAVCTAALAACKADPDCDAWSLCASACFTSGFSADCFGDCAGIYADGGDPTLLAPVMSCVCVSCPGLCAPMCGLTLEDLQPYNDLSDDAGTSYPPLPSTP